MRKSAPMSDRTGVILVVVILTLALVSTLCLTIFFSTQTALLESRSRLVRLRRELALESGLVAAKAILAHDAASSNIDCLTEDWAKPCEISFEGDCRLRFQLVDEQGKLNLNKIRFIDRDGRPTSEGRATEALLRRWKAGSEPAERSGVWPRPLEDLAQVLPPERRSVRTIYDYPGQTNASEQPLSRPFTVHGPGRVNVNTASREVLACVLGERFSFVADRIVQSRDSKPFDNLAPLRTWPGMQPQQLAELETKLTVSSNWFSTLFVAQDSAGRSLAFAVFERDQQGVHVRQWKEF